MNLAKLLPFLAAAFPSVALAGPYGPFDSAENNVVVLNGCETVRDVQQVYPPLGSVDFARAGDETRLHLTMAGNEHYEAQVFSGAVPRGQRVNANVQAADSNDVRVDGAVCDDLNGDEARDSEIEAARAKLKELERFIDATFRDATDPPSARWRQRD